MIYLFSDIQNIDDSDYYRLLALASPDRIKKLMRYRFMKDKKLGLLAYLLLRFGLREEYGFSDKPEFYYGLNNKPYLKHPRYVYFNLSHCASGVACGISTEELGVDIQDITPYAEEDVYSILSENEKQLLMTCEDKDLTFTILWALKESYLKYSGQGITEHLMTYDFSSFTWQPFWLYGHRFTISQQKNCVISICSNKDEGLRVIGKSDIFSLI